MPLLARFERQTSAFIRRKRVICPWQEDLEHASGGPIACELNAFSFLLHRPPSDCKTQAYAAFFSRAAGVQAIETIKNTIPMRGGNSRSGVSYLDDGLP